MSGKRSSGAGHPPPLMWEISVPIFKKAVILRQLGLAVGVPFGIVALVVGLSSGKSVYTLYALGLIAALLFFTWLFIMAVYRGKYDAEFVLDERGARCRTQAVQAASSRYLPHRGHEPETARGIGIFMS